jgi:hypothetical protein
MYLGSHAKLVQIVSYHDGDYYYKMRWELTNTSGSTFNDLRFIHGGDTYFGGSDSARSWWNSSQNMLYVNNNNFSNSGIMGFYGSQATPADHYFGGNYSTGRNYAYLTGRLPDTADSNFVDAGWTSNGIADNADSCQTGALSWTSDGSTDHDSDGCKDDVEDADDDNDGVSDNPDACPLGEVGWTSNPTTDHDGDGCKDSTDEDQDDDNDGVADDDDSCATGELNWTSDGTTDHDGDGCKDDAENDDNDNDGVADDDDSCPTGDKGWTSKNATDHDGDGCQDDTDNDGTANYLDEDSDGDGITDAYEGSEDSDDDGEADYVDEDSDDDGIADKDDHGFGLAVAPWIDLPTGDETAFLGRNGVAGGGEVAGALRWDRLTVGSSVGVNFQPRIDVQNLDGSDQLRLGLSVGYTPLDRWGLTAELLASAALSKNDVAGTGFPAETRVITRHVLTSGLTLLGGGAVGISHGAGAANWRLFLGTSFGPTLKHGEQIIDTVAVPSTLEVTTASTFGIIDDAKVSLTVGEADQTLTLSTKDRHMVQGKIQLTWHLYNLRRISASERQAWLDNL